MLIPVRVDGPESDVLRIAKLLLPVLDPVRSSVAGVWVVEAEEVEAEVDHEVGLLGLQCLHVGGPLVGE